MDYDKLLKSKGFSFYETEPLDDDYYELQVTKKKDIWNICKIFGIGYANPTDDQCLILYCRASFENCFIAYGIKYIEMNIKDFIDRIRQL